MPQCLNSTHDLFRWFKENRMKANSEKCLLLVTADISVSVNVNDFKITNRAQKKSLCIKFNINSLLKTLSQVSVKTQVKN